MTDEHSPDQPPEQNEGIAADAAGEEDINALLENASSLAAELGGDVGGPGSEAKPQQVEEPLGSGSDVTEDVDRTLAEMESLLDAAAEQVGTDSASGPDSVETSATDTEQPTPADESAPDAQDKPDARDHSGGGGSSPAMDMSFDELTADSLGGDIPSLDDPGEKPEAPPAKKKDDGAEPESPQPPSAPQAQSGLQRIGSKLSSAAAAGCTCGATVLEIADRPFTRISERVRTLIGWVALATFGTAVVVFLISLF